MTPQRVTHCTHCGEKLSPEESLHSHLCERCEDERDADAHPEGCDCVTCERVRSR